MKKPRLLFISLEHWDDVWRRNQFLAMRMQKDFQVTFVGPSVPVWQIFTRKPKHYQQITLKYIYKFFPDTYFKKINERLYAWQYPQNTDVLWINDHTKYFLLQKMKYQKSIYDITDDWTLLNKTAIGPDRFLCQAADTTIVCSQGLLKSRKKFAQNIVLIKNGVIAQDYKITAKEQKYFLYTGSLHEDRVDVRVMQQLAKKFPQERFVYVGPNFMSARTTAAVTAYSNIELVGAKPYKQMASYMSAAKALIVPHVESAFVNSLDPIKQYEYMLSAVPVITTRVSGFNEWPRLFTVVPAKLFAAAIDQVIRGKIAVDIQARRKAMRQCSWDMRYKQVQGVVCAKNF